MIVWNVEDILLRALESTVGLADEVIIVDTGSDDNTVKVAQDFGAKVFVGADRMHKGESRNKALEAATGDWTVVLDSDEVVADPKAVREYLEATDAEAVFVRIEYKGDLDETTMFFYQMRAWQRGAYEYRYRAHEIPIPSNGVKGTTYYSDLVWNHYRQKDASWKTQYTLDRLLLDVEEHPEATRPLFYIGRQYFYMGEWERAISWLQKYLDGTLEADRDCGEAYGLMFHCHNRLGNPDEALRYLYDALRVEPYRRDWYGKIAEIHHTAGRYNLALGFLKAMFEIEVTKGTYINRVWYGHYPHDLAARCLWKLGRYDEGREYAETTLALDPINQRLKDNLAFFVDKTEAQSDGYYDAIYAEQEDQPWLWEKLEHFASITSAHTVGSVLDLGCGPGVLANSVSFDHPYLGIDFSAEAIRLASEKNLHPAATFIKADLRDLSWQELGPYDTVVLSEVLEHLDSPQEIVNLALQVARRRVVVTVPVNMSDPGHIKPEWSREDLIELLNPLTIVEMILDGVFWLAIKEIQ